MTSTLAAAGHFARVSDDLTIHYRRAGSGPRTVLLVPGWTMTSDVFERQLEHFSGSTTHTLIAIDPRSHGLSTRTAEGNFYEQHGRDLDAFMRALGLQNIVLGGWSNGGFAILSYIHQFGPGNLRGLVMLDATPTALGADTAKDWAWFRRDDADGFRKGFTQGVLNDRIAFNRGFAEWMVETPTEDYVAWITAISMRTGDGTAALLQESSAYQDYAADLAALEGRFPLLYFVNAGWAEIVGDWARRHTPSARVVALGKHLAFWERSGEFNAVLDSYLLGIGMPA